MADEVTRRRSDGVLLVAAAVGSLGLAVLAGRDPDGSERSVFDVVNHGVGRMQLLRLPQQLGTPWVLPVLAGVGWLTRHRHLALAAALAVPVEKAAEVALKHLVPRERPARSLDGVALRDDAPVEGGSYPSGHAALATCGFLLAAPYCRPSVNVVTAPVVLTAVATRVHQGAHHPLDAMGGVVLGTGVAALLRLVVGVPGPT